MEKVRIPKLLWAIIIFAVLVNLATIAVALRSPGGTSYPQIVQTSPEKVDYGKVDDFINHKVNSLDIQNGVNGVNGTNGHDGINGINGENANPQQVSTSVATYLAANPPPPGEKGQQGDPGIPGASVELRYNSEKSQIEWKYTTDFTWRTLVSACTLTNTCP